MTTIGTIDPPDAAGCLAAGSSCPKCGFVQAEESGVCAACGVIFARLQAMARFPPLRPSQPGETGETRLDTSTLRVLGGGLIAAGIVLALPFLSFVFSYLVVLVHELGHTAVSWAFGYPAIPAFDFVYGGGVSIHEDRSWPLLGFVGAGWLALGYWVRHHRRLLGMVVAGMALFTLLAFTPGHEVLHIAGGHLAELIFSGIFLYRALSGNACHFGGERGAYSAAGWFIILFDIRFAAGLAFSPEKRLLYEEAKGGGRWMDLSVLAEQYWGTDLATVATLLLALVLLTPAAVFLIWRARTGLARTWEWCFGTSIQ